MNEEHKIRSLRASIAAMLVTLKTAEDESKDNAQSYREAIEETLDEYLYDIKPDPTAWPSLKTKLFYDVYLLQRKEEGTLTPGDLVRTGLTIGQFSDSVSYHQHCIRVSENRRADFNEAQTKVCTSCGEEKSASKFKRRGGAKCNACRSKEYRERRREA